MIATRRPLGPLAPPAAPVPPAAYYVSVDAVGPAAEGGPLAVTLRVRNGAGQFAAAPAGGLPFTYVTRGAPGHRAPATAPDFVGGAFPAGAGTIPAGQTSHTLNFPTLDDNASELAEGVEFELLTVGNGAAFGNPVRRTGEIAASDQPVTPPPTGATLPLSAYRFQPGTGVVRARALVPLRPGQLAPGQLGAVRLLDPAAGHAPLAAYVGAAPDLATYPDGSLQVLEVEADLALSFGEPRPLTLALGAGGSAPGAPARQGFGAFDNTLLLEPDPADPARWRTARALVFERLDASDAARPFVMVPAGTPLPLPAFTANPYQDRIVVVCLDTAAGALRVVLDDDPALTVPAVAATLQCLHQVRVKPNGSTFTAGTTPLTEGALTFEHDFRGFAAPPVAQMVCTDAAHLAQCELFGAPTATLAAVQAYAGPDAQALRDLDAKVLFYDALHWRRIGNTHTTGGGTVRYGAGLAQFVLWMRGGGVRQWWRGAARAQFWTRYLDAQRGITSADSNGETNESFALHALVGDPMGRKVIGGNASYWAYRMDREFLGFIAPYPRDQDNPLTANNAIRIPARVLGAYAHAHAVNAPGDPYGEFSAYAGPQDWAYRFTRHRAAVAVMVTESGKDVKCYKDGYQANVSAFPGGSPYTAQGPDDMLRVGQWDFAVLPWQHFLLLVSMRLGVERGRLPFSAANRAAVREAVRRMAVALHAHAWRDTPGGYLYVDRQISTGDGPGVAVDLNGFAPGVWAYLAETESDAALRATYAQNARTAYVRTLQIADSWQYGNAKQWSEFAFDTWRALPLLLSA